MTTISGRFTPFLADLKAPQGVCAWALDVEAGEPIPI
jgi:hypothetical protein